MDKSRSSVSGATIVEFAFVLPLIIGLMFAGLFFTIYAVTQLTFSLDTTRIAEQTVSVSPRQDQNDYLAAVCAFVTNRMEAEDSFYASFVNNIRIVSIETEQLTPTSGQSVVTITREGQFNFLNSQRWGVPTRITASGSALLPANAGTQTCGST